MVRRDLRKSPVGDDDKARSSGGPLAFIATDGQVALLVEFDGTVDRNPIGCQQHQIWNCGGK